MATSSKYDETKHCGVNYNDAEQVRRYGSEKSMKFRFKSPIP